MCCWDQGRGGEVVCAAGIKGGGEGWCVLLGGEKRMVGLIKMPHPPESDPVGAAAGGHQCLEVISTHKVRGTLVDPLGDPLQDTQGDVPAISEGRKDG